MLVCLAALLTLAGNCHGQAAAIYNARINPVSPFTDPAQAGSDGWFAFSLAVPQDTRSPCCWTSHRASFGETGCSLQARHESYGTRSSSPLTRMMVLYGRSAQGRIESLRAVGARCPVDAVGQELSWYGEVDEGAGLDWLTSLARSDNAGPVSESALHALALLGSSRALERLKAIGANDEDPRRRGAALFWIGQEFPDQAPRILSETLEREQNAEALELVLLAVAELPDHRGGALLMDIARDGRRPRELRRQALFWLVHSGDDKDLAALTELLSRQEGPLHD
jgi:hypothetical protein